MTTNRPAPTDAADAVAHVSGEFDIEQAQRRLARAGTPVLRTEEVAVSAAAGRVLAEPLPMPADIVGSAMLDAGVRLQGKHLPQIACLGRPAVHVFERLKVGVLPLGPAVGREPVCHGLAGPVLASLLGGLGTHAIAAPRIAANNEALQPVLDMLLKECRLVLISGAVTPQRQQQVDQALGSRGASVGEWRLCDDLGARLMVATLGDRLVIGLPWGLAEAFKAFVLMVTPAIRHLQGRTDLLPSSRAATLNRPQRSAPVKGRFLWARETDYRSEIALHLRQTSQPGNAIACADGIARGTTSSVLSDIVGAHYYPFSTWLQ
jgi:molybdopterin molybdotransferase